MTASGRLAEVLCHQAAILLPGNDNPQPDHVQLEYSSRLIKLMQPFSAIDDLVRQHYKTSQVLTVAAPLVLGSLPHVKAMLDQKYGDVEVTVRTVNENTLRPYIIDASITATNFHSLFTGQNLRWEYIGFLLTCAGRFVMIGQVNSPHFTNEYGAIIDRKTFVHEMMMASRTCVALCGRMAPWPMISWYGFYTRTSYSPACTMGTRVRLSFHIMQPQYLTLIRSPSLATARRSVHRFVCHGPSS